ncbi:MAG: phosphotransferase system enzyme I PtsI [Limisphaerales bacterium]|nr:MAG: phosphotransferase system enzyme I PtsI [Limisphaerales bacterium]TXT49141.1 MAG: phosphotransferase system enzyme I PtsI [Limisphaerales bacterium]
MPERTATGEAVFRGIPVSTGVCVGKILLLGQQRAPVTRQEISEAEVPRELERLEQGLLTTRQQLHDIQQQVTQAMGAKDASIFEAHVLVLDDPTLLEGVTRMIADEKVTAEWAFHIVAERFAKTLEALPDDYLRERVADLRDVAARVVNNLLGHEEAVDVAHLKEPCIVIAHDLAPSTTARLDKKMVLGFGTDVGGKTSHTAIMARSLRIPAVVGLQRASHELHTGQTVLLDGFNGLVVLNPTDQTLFEYGQIEQRQKSFDERLREIHDQPAVTLDGAQIVLSANVEEATDAAEVKLAGGEGVGLFRTEFLFLNRSTLPSEEEQYQTYRQVASELKPAPVIIRTLDLGGDKLPSIVGIAQDTAEMNPFLGWRAIRFCLQESAVFRAQLRAILRASAEGNVKIMYPMISGLEELTQSNELVEQCKAELRAAGVPFDENLEIGAMIEIPSAVMIADSLAKRVKFFSIGTNDLIQYTLAVDRLNEKIAYLYDPTHPAVLRLIKLTVESAHRHGIWVGVCGEMASDPAMVPLLLGLGVDELSTTPPLVPPIKYIIRRLKLAECKELADFALSCESSAEILTRSQALVSRAAPDLFGAN